MSFEPHGEKHAIIEVVFGLQLARNFTASELETFVAAHSKFKADLPKLNRTQVLQVMFGEAPANIPFPAPVGGVAFDAVKKDGSLDSRLRVDDNNIFVNCLSYTRWSEIWPKAREYLTAASEIVVSSDNAIAGMILQYIDIFRWTEAPDTYDPRLLLDAGSDHVPASVLGCGPFWHLHQGWFRTEGLPVPGRLLERLHLDAVLDDKGVPVVKVDTFLHLELASRLSAAATFADKSPVGDLIFDGLHRVNKALLKSFLTDELAKRIGLSG